MSIIVCILTVKCGLSCHWRNNMTYQYDAHIKAYFRFLAYLEFNELKYYEDE